jgi:hypothetical protein
MTLIIVDDSQLANTWPKITAHDVYGDGKEWERTGNPRFFLGGCNFRKGNYLRFCRESNSQCGGQGFDPPLLHQ